TLVQRKELFDRHLELARKIQRDFRIGNVRPAFDRVYRLAAHGNSTRQVGRAHAPALSNLGQPVLDARLHDDYSLTQATRQALYPGEVIRRIDMPTFTNAHSPA